VTRKGEGRIRQRVHFPSLEIAQRVVEAFSLAAVARPDPTLATHRLRLA